MSRHRRKTDLFNIFRMLKKQLKLKHDILLRRKKLSKDCGECVLDGDDEPIRITVDKNLSEQSQIDTLLHEYAHALRMDKHDDRCNHCKKWGIEFSRVWRRYERYCDEK